MRRRPHTHKARTPEGVFRCRLCDRDAGALKTVSRARAVSRSICHLCRYLYKGPWEMQSSPPPTPFLCVWSLQSVNMSLLIAIRARISQMHFPFPPYIRLSLRFISLTVTAAFQSHCPDSFWSFCPFIFGISQACSL